MGIKEIENLVNYCLHCGRKPEIYHRDYEGDYFCGDEYDIECECGISTGFHRVDDTLKIWNNKYEA